MSRTRRYDEQDEVLNVITLRRSHDAWLAQFQGPDRDHMIALFGTDTIPTAYTPEASPEQVLQGISELNPGHVVKLAEDEGPVSKAVVNWDEEGF